MNWDALQSIGLALGGFGLAVERVLRAYTDYKSAARLHNREDRRLDAELNKVQSPPSADRRRSGEVHLHAEWIGDPGVLPAARHNLKVDLTQRILYFTRHDRSTQLKYVLERADEAGRSSRPRIYNVPVGEQGSTFVIEIHEALKEIGF